MRQVEERVNRTREVPTATSIFTTSSHIRTTTKKSGIEQKRQGRLKEGIKREGKKKEEKMKRIYLHVL